MIFEECPQCHLVGKRKTLAVYDDGHKYCFYCSYYQSGSRIAQLNQTFEEDDYIKLPYDSSPLISKEAVDWLKKYDLTRMDVLYHKLMWSPSKQYLIFPFNVDNTLLAWQARDFKPEPKSKWFSQGNLRELFHIVGNFPERDVVIVEDIVSAIKVGKLKNTLCLFGSSPPDDVLARLKMFYDKVYIWLDPDAHPKVPKIQKKLELIGLTTVPIFTNGDPKEATIEEIKERLK